MFSNYLLICILVLISIFSFSNAATNQTQNTHPSDKVTYHGGHILTHKLGINIYLLWYGSFSDQEKTTIVDFFASFDQKTIKQEPSVFTWWKTTNSYKDKLKNPVSPIVKIAAQVTDAYSLGRNLKREDITKIMTTSINAKKLPLNPNGIYLVLTHSDVTVDRFCRDSCGFHDSTEINKVKIVYGHVGDSSLQCPAFCDWPYAASTFGPPGQKALVAPNSVAGDGLVINIATVIAGAATNPFKDGYFQGDATAPLEAVSACPGIFGAEAYPGNPGKLIVDKVSNASFNAYGANGKKYLLPAIWDLSSSKCKVVGTAPA